MVDYEIDMGEDRPKPARSNLAPGSTDTATRATAVGPGAAATTGNGNPVTASGPGVRPVRPLGGTSSAPLYRFADQIVTYNENQHGFAWFNGLIAFLCWVVAWNLIFWIAAIFTSSAVITNVLAAAAVIALAVATWRLHARGQVVDALRRTAWGLPTTVTLPSEPLAPEPAAPAANAPTPVVVRHLLLNVLLAVPRFTVAFLRAWKDRIVLQPMDVEAGEDAVVTLMKSGADGLPKSGFLEHGETMEALERIGAVVRFEHPTGERVRLVDSLQRQLSPPKNPSGQDRFFAHSKR